MDVRAGRFLDKSEESVWRATPRGKGSWEIQVRVRMEDAGGD
jgi:hypothetical protein